ncbi:MAG: 2-succinyl-5-enolpyruvyl-6-hydroxy-3-cyclohexene-1-carboxylic-acid synthase [Crocinitomicaceae bacterium]|nr:2-succinyl-5-enolpyruvyl-6-hydroxy-3-cyclohexene-1-carboxylic-acid synthase [Crocinitomicaceae bacterium]
MRTTAKTGISLFIQECYKNGLEHIVCSPGSRNAPIVIAADAHPHIKTYVIHDERVAAFFALGMSDYLKKAVAVVCTSGSALLNYYPAVAEAYYRSIPLVVISADRPQEWINHGDGQTIVQKNVYKEHIRFEGEIDELDKKNGGIENTVKTGFQSALTNWKGPIHFNIPLSEPLYNLAEIEEPLPRQELFKDMTLNLTEKEKETFVKEWNSSKRKIILCGQMDPNPVLKQRLSELSNDPSVAILVENTSNMSNQRWIHCIDRTLAGISEGEIEKFQPDLLVTIGGAIISKRIKRFLREAPIQRHWKVGFDFPEMDTYRKLTSTILGRPADFFQVLLSQELTTGNSNFGSVWKQRDFEIQERLSDFFDTSDYSDISVFELLLDYVPENAYLHMANSSVVRYCQLFEPISSLRYFANRGTSGIDGATSTAVGIAAMSVSKCNVFFTGDISFFYDSNALWNKHLTGNLRIFLINNSGGGIFRIIDGPRESEQLETYFEAQHDTKAEYICKAFDINYNKADSLESIESQLPEFYADNSNRPKLMEISTPNVLNDQVLKSFFNKAKK